jgi:hypothetical protein
MNPISLRNKILSAATERNDQIVLKRLTSVNDLLAVNARYHRNCVQPYTSINNINNDKITQYTPAYDKAAEKAFDCFKNDISSQKIILGPVIYNRYKQFLIDEGVDSSVAKACRQSFIRNKMHDKFGHKISFHSQPGNLYGQ